MSAWHAAGPRCWQRCAFTAAQPAGLEGQEIRAREITGTPRLLRCRVHGERGQGTGKGFADETPGVPGTTHLAPSATHQSSSAWFEHRPCQNPAPRALFAARRGPPCHPRVPQPQPFPSAPSPAAAARATSEPGRILSCSEAAPPASRLHSPPPQKAIRSPQSRSLLLAGFREHRQLLITGRRSATAGKRRTEPGSC